MSRIICPFCLKPHDFRSSLECSEYSEQVPAVYVNEYNRVPPMWLATVGFSQHGKTTYLAALTLMLKKGLPYVLPGVYYRPLDQYTVDEIRKMQSEAKFGKLPDSNKTGVSRPLLFSVYNLPECGSRCLVMYDVAGEVYDSLGDISKYIPSIKEVNTTWFLVSLSDLEGDEQGKTIDELFYPYLSGMEEMRVDLNNRNLIVIYTKADKLTFTPAIKSYLRHDPFQGLTRPDMDVTKLPPFSFHEYVEEMQTISEQLEEYTRRIPGGIAFINMVRAKGMNLVFSLTSALGQDSIDGRLQENANRYRVLDPFLWAITLETPTSTKPVGLILDASRKSRSVYDKTLLLQVWDSLSDHGALTTYCLGQKTAVSQPGQQPPVSPPSVPRHRLIGPILENASPDTRFIVITTGHILDLADFYNTAWRDHLLLVTMGEDHQQDWPNVLVYRNGDDPMALVDALLSACP